MTAPSVIRRTLFTIGLSLLSASAIAQTAATQKPYEPQVGQAGKDVVWVPTPQTLVDKMLEMAKVTAKDVVYDLGCGDGRSNQSAPNIRNRLQSIAGQDRVRA